jgi:excinuclease ABC subunit C
MSKDGLYSGPTPIDLGPTAYLPTDWPVRKTHIAGLRSNQLRTQLRLLAPNEPGVYAMLNADDEIIYVGKAKNLRKRLFSYFRVKGRDRRARRIVARARVIVWEVLPSEFTALLRELELIRRWRPTWNVQGQPLRRRHAYICLGHRPAPYLTLTRKPPKHLIASFGPMPVTNKSRAAVRWLNDAFGLRDCPPGVSEFFPSANPLYANTPPAGCLRLELGTCLGPCTCEVTRTKYHQQTRAVRAFLDGRDRGQLTVLEEQMHAAAQAQRFEAAAHLRDKWTALAWLVERLDRVKHAQKELSFVYPVPAGQGHTLWYLLHGARVLGCVAAPHDAATAEAANAELGRIYGPKNAGPLLDAYEPIDGMVLVLGWFRKFPTHRRRSHAPAAALEKVRKLLGPADVDLPPVAK